MLEMVKKNALFVLNLVLLTYWWMYWFDIRSQHCWSYDCGWIPVVIALVKLKLLLSGTLNENGEPGDKNVQVSKALTIGLQLVSHKKCKVLKTRCLWSLQYIEQYGLVSTKVHGASMCSLCFGVFQCCSCLLVGQFRASEGRWRVKVGTWSSKSPPFSSILSSLPVNKQVGRASGL